jgi:hypothetical protein
MQIDPKVKPKAGISCVDGTASPEYTLRAPVGLTGRFDETC